MVIVNEKWDHMAVVGRTKAGDEEAVEEMVEIVRRRVWPFIYKRVRNEDVAADLMQETLLSVVGRLDGLVDTRGFWGWVFVIARNKVIDYGRRQRVQQIRYFSTMDKCEFERITGDYESCPSRQTVIGELTAAVEKACDGLSGRMRDVFVMRAREQMEYQAIADELGCSVEAARVAFMRARRKLAGRIGKRMS